jgi:Tfp pilus assembly protein PilF
MKFKHFIFITTYALFVSTGLKDLRVFAQTSNQSSDASEVTDQELVNSDEKTKKGDYASTIDDLSKVIARKPNSGKAYLTRGSLYLLNKDYQNAEEDLRKASLIFSKRGNKVLEQEALRQLELVQKLNK